MALDIRFRKARGEQRERRQEICEWFGFANLENILHRVVLFPFPTTGHAEFVRKQHGEKNRRTLKLEASVSRQGAIHRVRIQENITALLLLWNLSLHGQGAVVMNINLHDFTSVEFWWPSH